MANISELMQSLSDSVDTMKAKQATAEETAAIATAAKQDYQRSAEYVQELRKQLNDVLGSILPASDPRVRTSA